MGETTRGGRRALLGAFLALLLGLPLVACSAEAPPSLDDMAYWRGRLARGDAAAVKALQKAGASAVPLLVVLLADDDVTVVTSAGLVAEGLGEETYPLAPALLGAVVRFPGDPRMLAPLRTRAAKPTLAPFLLGVLETGTPEQKVAAVEVLTHYGPLAAPGVAAIVPFLRHEDATVRLNAMNALSGIGAEATAALPALEAAQAKAASDHEGRTASAAIQHIQAKAKQAAAGG